MLTKSLIKKAQAMTKNWNTENDTGVFIDKCHRYCLERVPDWVRVSNWTELDLTPLDSLREDFTYAYDKVAPLTFNELIKESEGFRFVIEDYSEDDDSPTYDLNELLLLVKVKFNLKNA